MVSAPLGGKLSWISGAGGNIAVFGGDDGVLGVNVGVDRPELVGGGTKVATASA